MDTTQSESLATHACAEGRRAGLMLLSPSLNPYRDDDPLHAQWEQCWRQAVAEQVWPGARRFDGVKARAA